MKKIYSLSLLLSFSYMLLNSQVTYTGKPTYKIEVKRAGVSIGSINIELFPSLAYHHVRNFDSLVSTHFYDSTAFHRVVPGFMIQGGGPNSRHGTAYSTWGVAQPGQPIVNAEFSTVKHLRGILSAARNSNINSATSQFFICVATAANLDGNYSVYGRVTSGMNIVDTIVFAPTIGDRPNLKHEMFITATGSNDSLVAVPTLSLPANGAICTPTSASTPVLLKWNTVLGAIEYELEVSDDPFYLNIVKNSKTSGNTSYLGGGLNPDTYYYWHVRANNGGHISNWTTDYMFSTAVDAVGIKTREVKVENIKIYPNPSSGKFSFSNIDTGSHLEVFDITGKSVFKTEIKENNFMLDLEGREKGIYMYRITSTSTKSTQGKLILK